MPLHNHLIQHMSDLEQMQAALTCAKRAAELGEVPVGAVLTYNNKIIAQAYNRSIIDCNPTAHAEILALQQAGKYFKNYRLSGCTLYVTVEPCTMCAGALIHSRIERLVFGTTEPKSGAVLSNLRILDQAYMNHKVLYTHGILESDCRQIIQNFFKLRRNSQ